jgi:hypothetical protein
MIFKRLIRKYTGRTYLNQVPAEFIFEDTVVGPSEKHMIMGGESIQVVAACIIPVKTNTAVTLNAPVHLMVDEGAEILVAVSSLGVFIPPVIMTRHDGHILKMTFPAFITDRAVMGVIGHQRLNNISPEHLCFGIVDGDYRALGGRLHAGHDDTSPGILIILELLNGALTASPYGAQFRVPAEIRQIKTQLKACFQEILLRLYIKLFPVDIDLGHY